MLEKHGHGGDTRSAVELFGFRESELLDYSSNMNPFGPPQSFKTIIEEYWKDIHRYPDPIQRDLIGMIAQYHAVEQNMIIAGNGAAELIDLAVRVIQPKKAALIVPSFKEYEDALLKVNCTIQYILGDPNHLFMPTREQLLLELQHGADLFMIGYPNNPTGALLPMEDILALLESGAYVIVDEAFLNFHPNEQQLTMIQQLHTYDRLMVIRSMTKMYSIPGIRLGYLIAHAPLITRLKQLQYPWSVNSLSQRLGIQALLETQYVESTRIWLTEEIAWMRAQLTAIGLSPFSTVTNYMLVKLDDKLCLSSSELQQEMGKRGVLIRDGSTFKGLSDRYIRLAIKDRQSNAKMLDILAETIHLFRGE